MGRMTISEMNLLIGCFFALPLKGSAVQFKKREVAVANIQADCVPGLEAHCRGPQFEIKPGDGARRQKMPPGGTIAITCAEAALRHVESLAIWMDINHFGEPVHVDCIRRDEEGDADVSNHFKVFFQTRGGEGYHIVPGFQASLVKRAGLHKVKPWSLLKRPFSAKP